MSPLIPKSMAAAALILAVVSSTPSFAQAEGVSPVGVQSFGKEQYATRDQSRRTWFEFAQESFPDHDVSPGNVAIRTHCKPVIHEGTQTGWTCTTIGIPLS